MTEGIDRRIYIATILLERNRWTPEMVPAYRVSEWVPRFAEAGFDGMELWENHAALADADELAALEACGFPVSIFNTYADFDDAGEGDRRRAAELAGRLGAERVKFNFGRDPARSDAYLRNLAAWAPMLPAGCRPLCECHPGTVLEEAEDAATVLADAADLGVEVILHALLAPEERVRRYLELFGPAVTHIHVQLTDEDGQRTRLDADPDLVRERLRILREGGFCGSYSLEFTAGTATPDEDMETLWQNALADLAFLREELA